MTELCDLTLTELSGLLADGGASATEALESHLRRIEERNGELNAVVTLDADGARARAREADRARHAGRTAWPLHGAPMTLKDGHDVAGLRTTVGTTELDRVADVDGTVAARLRAAGVNLIGHTNVAAWLADHQTGNALFGRTNNPWDPARTPGGSSGGAAVAVATGMTPAEVGSDLVGSVRQPAALCGVYGLRPTEHRVPATGFFRVPGSPRPVRVMTSLGPLARSLDDVELVLSVISGPDGYDADVPPVPLRRLPGLAPRDLRVAVAPAIPGAPVAGVLSDRVRSVADGLADAGARVTEALPEVSWDEQLALFGDLLMTITSVFPKSEHTLADYLTMLDRRDGFVAAWERFFEGYDVLLMPAAATVAYPHSGGDEPLDIDGRQVPYHEQGFIYAGTGLTGLPGLAVPAGLDDGGLPVAVQLAGPRWSEPTLLAAARGLEYAGITPGFRGPGS